MFLKKWQAEREDNMSEINSIIENRKPKTSKLAIVCILVPLVLFVISLCFIVLLQSENYEKFEMIVVILFPFVALSMYILPLNFLLGIYALVTIKRSKGLLKGYMLSILSMLMSFLVLGCAAHAIHSTRPEGLIRHYKLEMVGIGKALQIYSSEYDNHYPTADKWCDLLVEHTNVEKTVSWLAAKQEWERDSFQYAINPNCEPNSPSDTVLLFETKGGWNKFGGPEILSIENHYRKGCNILFNDEHAEFTKPKQIEQLKWKDK
jgi:hypothetical protein